MPNYIWDGITIAIVSLIVSGISYGAYPYYLSKKRKETITTKALKYQCILYTIFIFILWCAFDELTKHVFHVFDLRGGAIIFGLVFYSSAKGRLRTRGLLVEHSSKKKQEKPTFDVTEQDYERAMRIISLSVHSKEIKELARAMGKTPRETIDHFTGVVQNYNLKRYSEQESPKPVSIEPEQQAALPEPVKVEPEQPPEQPAEEPEIQRWYTCPKCGQLVKDGEECDCEAVKLALEEKRKKKAEKVQQRKQTLRRMLPFCALAAVLLAAVCALGFYSYTLKGQVDELSAKNNKLSAKNAELAESNKKLSLESKDRLQSIYELTTDNNKLKEEYSNILDDYVNDIELTHFYYNKIGLIVNGSNRYHRFDCPIFQEADRFWAHNIEYCEDIGYSKCPDCW